MTKEKRNKKILTLISIIASVSVYIGAVLVYLYANGWRIDPFNQQVIKTGVLTVESDPFLATLFIERESRGRTPRSASLNVGEYNISVRRDGYIEWQKRIEIKEEKSTNVYPWLIRERIEKQNISTIEGRKYIKSWESENRDRVLILTSKSNEGSAIFDFELWLYTVNTTFWDLSSNPKVVLSFQAAQEPTIDLLPSPAGVYWLLKYTQENTTTSYLLDTSKNTTLENLAILNISPFDSYEISWARNNQYLMFESEQDLISFSIDRQNRYLLIKKTPNNQYIWNTDEQGYFYILESALENETERVYAYILTQQEMDGSNPKILVNDLFFQKNKDYLNRYIEDTSPFRFTAFTNSTASTRSVGKVEYIRVNQSAQGIYIQTTLASYWYNMKTKRYYMITPFKSEFVSFAPDNRKLIYRDENEYGVFTFLKEESNPNVEIGAKRINNISLSGRILGWLSNSSYIYYVEDNRLYIADKDGDNKTLIFSNADTNLHLGMTSSRDYLFTISILVNPIDGQEIISIDKYLVH